MRLGWWRGSKSPQQRAKPPVLQFPLLLVEAVLQRFAAIEYEQHPAFRQLFGDRLSLRSGARRFDLDAELPDNPAQKLLRGRRALLGALAVERPAKDCLRAPVVVGSHALEPFV